MQRDPQLVDLEQLKTLMTGVNLNDANLPGALSRLSKILP